MKMNVLMVVVVAACLAVSDARLTAADTPRRDEAGQVGRYQLVASSDGEILLLDTATGQCWYREPSGKWHAEGNPTQTQPQKSERQAKHKPPTLNLPEKVVEMTIVQREERDIPGSDGTVRIQLGDITEGQVLLAVLAADGETLLEKTSVAQADALELSVGGKRYTIQIKELRNHLVGDDFAVLTIAEASEPTSPEKRRRPD